MSLTTNTTPEICCFDEDINRVIYRSDEPGPKEHIGKLEIIPRRGIIKDFKDGTNMNENIYICGASGSGKTTIAREYAANYHRINPNNKIYLITQSYEDNLPEYCKVWTGKFADTTYNKYLNLEYLGFDYFLNSESIDITKDFFNSLVIFDDFLYFEGKDKNETELIKNRIITMIIQILTLGRKVSCSAIITAHLLYERKLNLLYQSIYCEINKFIFSIKSNRRQLIYVIKTYIGFTNNEIDEIFNFDNKSFMLTISKDPYFIMSSNKILLKR